jgi:uncharacterized protein (TIGR02611 family)
VAEEAAERRRIMERVRHRKELHKQRGRTYRIAFGIAGFVVLIGGVVLSLPFVPGPGLLFVAIGLGMLALEFAWAERLLERIADRLEQAGERAARATRGQRAMAAAATVACVVALVAAAVIWDVPGVPL